MGDTHLNGEAGFCASAALVTVNSTAEWLDDGRVRGEGQVVVRPLGKDGDQVSVERVVLHIRVCCSQNFIGHFSYLQTGCRQWTPWYPKGFVQTLSVFFSHLQHSKSRWYIKVCYQGKNMSVDFLLRVPANSLRDVILVLGREPAGEGCVWGSPSGVLPVRMKKKINHFSHSVYPLCFFLCICQMFECLSKSKYIKKDWKQHAKSATS